MGWPTMLRRIAAAATPAYVFFLSVQVSMQQKMGPRKIHQESQWYFDVFCDAAFLPESPYALNAAYGLNVSLRARVLFFIFSAKKMQNAEPATCV